MDQKTKVCQHCKSEIPADAKVCAHCARSVDKLEIASNQLMKSGCAILLVAFVLGAAMWFCIQGF